MPRFRLLDESEFTICFVCLFHEMSGVDEAVVAAGKGRAEFGSFFNALAGSIEWMKHRFARIDDAAYIGRLSRTCEFIVRALKLISGDACERPHDGAAHHGHLLPIGKEGIAYMAAMGSPVSHERSVIFGAVDRLMVVQEWGNDGDDET